MALDKKSFEVNIAGMTYKIRSSHDDETVQELVEFVDTKVRQAMSATKSGSLQNAAILAALNMAEELILIKKRAIRDLDRLEDKASRLATDLESSRLSKVGIDN